jgi:4-amino-4-deoxy-L-arabinose transferase-like glycosyltransferase
MRSSSRFVSIVWLTAILLVALPLRLLNLTQHSLWLDEAWSWLLVWLPWWEMWDMLLTDNFSSPLYYLAARGLSGLIGLSDFSLRLISVWAEVLVLPVVYHIGRSIGNRRVGLWAAALLALAPFSVWYAREARPYGFYLLFAALALWGFWRWAEQGCGPRLMVAAHTALYLTHYLGAAFALAEFVYLLLHLRQEPLRFRHWFAWQSLASIPAALCQLAFVLSGNPRVDNAWIPRITVFAPIQTLLNFISAEPLQLTWLNISLLVACLLIALTGIRLIWRTQQKAGQILLLWLLLPMTIAWLISFGRQPVYVDRYWYPQIIALVILLAYGLSELQSQPALWSRAAFGVSAFVLFLGMLASSARLHFAPQYAKEDWRGAANFLQAAYPNMPLFAQDNETALCLLPYRGNRPIAGLLLPQPAPLDVTNETIVVVLRSMKDSNHAFVSNWAVFDPLLDSRLSDWFAANADRIVEVRRFIGVGVVVLQP